MYIALHQCKMIIWCCNMLIFFMIKFLSWGGKKINVFYLLLCTPLGLFCGPGLPCWAEILFPGPGAVQYLHRPGEIWRAQRNRVSQMGATLAQSAERERCMMGRMRGIGINLWELSGSCMISLFLASFLLIMCFAVAHNYELVWWND